MYIHGQYQIVYKEYGLPNAAAMEVNRETSDDLQRLNMMCRKQNMHNLESSPPVIFIITYHPSATLLRAIFFNTLEGTQLFS